MAKFGLFQSYSVQRQLKTHKTLLKRIEKNSGLDRFPTRTRTIWESGGAVKDWYLDTFHAYCLRCI